MDEEVEFDKWQGILALLESVLQPTTVGTAEDARTKKQVVSKKKRKAKGSTELWLDSQEEESAHTLLLDKEEEVSDLQRHTNDFDSDNKDRNSRYKDEGDEDGKDDEDDNSRGSEEDKHDDGAEKMGLPSTLWSSQTRMPAILYIDVYSCL